MINVHEWRWVVDIDGMTCENVENEVTVNIHRDGETLRGMLQDMPMGLFAKISKEGNGEEIIEEIVKAAETHFRRTAGPLLNIENASGRDNI